MKHFKSYVVIVLLLFILVVLSFVCAAWWNPFTWNRNIFSIFSKPQTSVVQNNQNVNQKPTDQTAGWETYRNGQYGFEIKHPIMWKDKLGEYAGWNSPIKRPEDVFIAVNISPTSQLGTITNGCPDLSVGKIIGKVKLNGLEFCKTISKSTEMANKALQSFDYFTVNGNFSYDIGLYVYDGRQTENYFIPESEFKYELNVLQQMVSTFKFNTN
jgi:hypothetical protein